MDEVLIELIHLRLVVTDLPRIQPPEIADDEILGGIYTPVDPVPYDNEIEVPDTTDSASLDNINDPDVNASSTQQPNPSTTSYPPRFDADVLNQTPGHHEADQDFEYDEDDVDQIAAA